MWISSKTQETRSDYLNSPKRPRWTQLFGEALSNLLILLQVVHWVPGFPLLCWNIMAMKLGVIPACVSYLLSTVLWAIHSFTKLEFGSIQTSVCRWFPIWDEQTFVHVSPGIASHNENLLRMEQKRLRLLLLLCCKEDEVLRKQHRNLLKEDLHKMPHFLQPCYCSPL